MHGDQQQAQWLNASQYENIPHNQVNWAALAQRWIAMRQTEEQQHQVVMQMQQQPFPPLPPSIPQPRPPEPPPFVSQNQPPFEGSYGRPPVGAWQQSPQPQFRPGPQPPRAHFDNWAPVAPPFRAPMGVRGPVPLMDVRPAGPPFMPGVRPRFGPRPPVMPFGIAKHQEQDFPDTYYDGAYSSTADPFTSYPGFDGAVHDLDYRQRFGRPPFIHHYDERSASNSPDMPLIANSDRKTLPSWIREGLEKMEKERQKKMMESDGSEQQEYKPNAVRTFQEEAPVKQAGRFESDSDDSADEAETARSNSEARSSPFSEEDLKEQMLLLLKEWMTEILLDATDDQVTEVVREIHKKALKKAQPKMLAQSSALAALGALGGAQDSDSDADESRSDDGASDAEDKRPDAPKELFKKPTLPVSFNRPAVSKQRIQIGSTPSSSEQTQTPDDHDDPKSKRKSRWSDEADEKPKEDEPNESDKFKRRRKSSSSPDRRRSRRSRSRSKERKSKRSRSKSQERDSKRNSYDKERDRRRSRESRHRRKSARRSRSPREKTKR